MNMIGKLFGLGVTIAIADIMLAQVGRKDIAYAITIAGTVIALMMVLPEMNNLFKTTNQMFGF